MKEWEDRQAGKRPVVQESLYLSYTKEFGISRDIKDHSHPFILPGLGKSGLHCMCQIVHGIGIDGTKLGYRNLKCKRIECPNCYSSWVLDRVFDVVFKLEAYAKTTGERPCHVTSEIIGVSSEAKKWDLNDYDAFHKRTYRHIKSIGGNAGLRMIHPYKIHKTIKEQLRKAGYGVAGNGFWKGIRENALNLPSFEAYYYLAPHDHTLVFPSFLKEHADNRFFVKKIGVLETMDDVIKSCYYLISHCGVLKDGEEIDNHPIVFFGDLHRFNPEKFLSSDEILDLKQQIAEKLHCSCDNGELKPLSDKVSNENEFIPINEFVFYSKEKEMWVNAMISSFPHAGFWMSLVLLYNDKLSNTELIKDEKHVFLTEISIPSDIKVVEVV